MEQVRRLGGDAINILSIGAGRLGSAVGIRLAESGAQVWAARRRKGLIPKPLRALEVDVVSGRGMDALPQDIDLVIYCLTPSSADDAGYCDAYVRGLKNTLAAVGNTPVLFVSSTGVYHQNDGTWVNEDSPARSERFSGGRILQGEALLDGRSISVRLGGIYGHGGTRLLQEAQRGWIYSDAAEARYTNRIHFEDALGALVHLARLQIQQQTQHACYLGVDSEPAARAEVLRWLQDQLNIVAHTEAPDDGETTMRAGSKRCCNKRLLESGYKLIYPDYRSGYAATIAQWRASCAE